MPYFWKTFLMCFGIGVLTPFGLTKRDALRDVMLDRCAGRGGPCWCRSATTCRFERCTNCDMPVDKSGRALMTDYVDAEPYPCPYCDGPVPRLR